MGLRNVNAAVDRRQISFSGQIYRCGREREITESRKKQSMTCAYRGSLYQFSATCLLGEVDAQLVQRIAGVLARAVSIESPHTQAFSKTPCYWYRATVDWCGPKVA
ncbi:hypothetical protein PSP6_130266 [Paraburkholderia tropica]|nr:hypothetical protein PSP6_130266 [Paraburkholderia tropica]